MIEKIRTEYNLGFKEETYKQFLSYFDQLYNRKVEFRIAETPVFIPKLLKEELIKAGDDILRNVLRAEYLAQSNKAIPKDLVVPNEAVHPNFIAVDFAITKDSSGNYLPQLIELQGFASLFFWQDLLPRMYKEYFFVPEGFSHFFNGYNTKTHRELMRKVIVGNHDPENVILLEIEPEKQKTWIDFWETKTHLGVEPVCISKIVKEDRLLYYEKDNRKILIKRIYNRVIFDELLQRNDLKRSFNLTEDVEVEWAGHPNWFFKISKYSMPFIKSKYASDCSFLSDLNQWPSDLENYVLKPLYSFAGSGVVIDVTSDMLDAIKPEDRNNFLLQKKVKYEPCLVTPSGNAKVEVRLLYIWPDNDAAPQLVLNLTRLSKGAMIGVSQNKNMDWVGGSASIMEI